MKYAPIHKSIESFSPISLEQLNETMGLMERKETKFLTSIAGLTQVIENLKDDYRLLTINDRHVFTYDNVYMDTNDYHFYNMHQRGNSKRTKIRTRCYVDSGLFFFEFKQKDNKKISKFRYKTSARHHGAMTIKGANFFQTIHENIYGEKFFKMLRPTLRNTYNRLTFCSKESAERITIDFNLGFFDISNPNNTYRLNDIAIIECKSSKSGGKILELFERLGIPERKACSKYCLGMSYLDKVSENSHFKETIEYIHQIEGIHTTKKNKKTSILIEA